MDGRWLRLQSEKFEEGIVGIAEAAVGRTTENSIALRVDESLVADFAFVETCIDRGNRRERSFELLGQRAQFGGAVLQRVRAPPRIDQAGEQNSHAQNRKRAKHKRREDHEPAVQDSVRQGRSTNSQRSQPENGRSGTRERQAFLP
jgi:hypothetical protein